LVLGLRRRPRCTLFPYTTLFRSEGVDAVVHLAALSNDPLCNLDPDLTYDINHRGSVRVAAAAKAAGASRFLLASSCSNYGRAGRSEERTSELQSRENLVCRLLLA